MILNQIKNKQTRLFATNSLSFLPECDRIIMLKDGEIKEIGTYNELRNIHGDFDEFLGTILDNLEGHHEKTYKILRKQ